MEQLKMSRNDRATEPITLPFGYYMRAYEQGDGVGWCKCCAGGSLGIEEISESVFEDKMLKDKNVNPAILTTQKIYQARLSG